MNNNIGIEEFDSTFFDESSRSWRMNKIEKKNGTYVYKCAFVKDNGEHCKLPICKNNNINCKKNILDYYNNYCYTHKNYNKKRKFDEVDEVDEINKTN